MVAWCDIFNVKCKCSLLSPTIWCCRATVGLPSESLSSYHVSPGIVCVLRHLISGAEFALTCQMMIEVQWLVVRKHQCDHNGRGEAFLEHGMYGA